MAPSHSQRFDRLAPQPKPRWPLAVISVLIGIGYVGWALSRPFPTLAAVAQMPANPTVTAGALPWPTYGQVALGIDGYGVITIRGAQTSHPIASIAKTILALQLLKQKPLKVGDTGPTITLTQADVDLYKSYLSQNGSVVPVQVGEQLTEYQALQALLLPSGDNIADTLAIWGFGSIDNYLKIANAYVASLGLNQTHLADPSGLSPQSVSSATDLVILGEQILAQPVLTEIVSQATTTLPVAGKVSNVNWLLGHDNISGIKTGNTDQAGGCFLFAAKVTLGGQNVTVIGAFLGAPSLSAVLHDADTFVQQIVNGIEPLVVARAGVPLATYPLPWGKSATVTVEQDVLVYAVSGAQIETGFDLPKISSIHAQGTAVGTLTVTIDGIDHKFPLILANMIPQPSIWWKLVHP